MSSSIDRHHRGGRAATCSECGGVVGARARAGDRWCARSRVGLARGGGGRGRQCRGDRGRSGAVPQRLAPRGRGTCACPRTARCRPRRHTPDMDVLSDDDDYTRRDAQVRATSACRWRQTRSHQNKTNMSESGQHDQCRVSRGSGPGRNK